MHDECQKTTSCQAAIKTHLLQTINYLACFAQNEVVRDNAKNLFNTLWANISGSFPDHCFTRNVKHSLESPKELLQKIDRELFGLEFLPISHVKETFLLQLGQDYFDHTLHASAKSTIEPEEIFDAKCPEAKDMPTKKHFKKIAEDVQVAQKLTHAAFSLKDDVCLDVLHTTVKEQYEIEVKRLLEQEELIVGSVGMALSSCFRSFLHFASKKRALPNVQEILLRVAKNNFPELSESSFVKLKSAIKQYLSQKQFVSHLAKVMQEAEFLLTKSECAQSILGHLLHTKPAYDIDTHELALALSIIETALHITLRSKQVEHISQFANALNQNQALCKQIIMGDGKTTVLQPILAILFTQQHALSTIVVPEALFEPVRESAEKTLGSSYDQFVFVLPYTRTLAKEPKYLATFYKDLQETKRRGACLLTTPRQRQSIITSLYDAYEDASIKPSPQKQERVSLISKSCRLFQFEEVVQIDELDFVMNSKILFKYPLGSSTNVNIERATLLSRLLIDLAMESELSVSIDFVNRMQKRQKGYDPQKSIEISKELFTSIVQPKLVQIARTKLCNHDILFKKIFDTDYDKERYLEHFLTQTSPFDDDIQMLCLQQEEMSIAYALAKRRDELEQIATHSKKPLERLIAQKLLYRRKMINWLMQEIPDIDKRDLVGVLAHAISNILPTSLLKECGVNYGIDLIGQKYVARPYDAAHSPKPTIYSDVYEQVIYSSQLALYYGVSEEGAKTMLSDLQRQAKLEVQQSGCLVTDAYGYYQFRRIMKDETEQFSLLEAPLSEKLVRMFQEKLSSDPRSMLCFLQGYVYNQISLYSQSVSCTPQTLAGSSKLACGYNGTLHAEILPRKMQVLAEIGTDGKTIIAVESKKPDVELYTEQPDKKIPAQVRERLLQDKDLDVFIDSGGWLKEEQIEQYAESVLTACQNSELRKNIKSVVYHNAKGVIFSVQYDSDGKYSHLPLSLSQYLPSDGNSITIILQKYETGTHITQKPTAKALMSVRKGMTLRDDLQSNARLRQIWQDQSIIFGMMPEVKGDIAAKIVDGLCSWPEFRALFNKDSDMSLDLITKTLDKLPLKQDLVDTLVLAFKELLGNEKLLTKFRSGRLKVRLFYVEFLRCLVQHIDVRSLHLWRYFAANRAADELDKNWHAARQRMREVIEKPFRLILIDNTIAFDERLQFYRLMKGLVIQTQEDSPFMHMVHGSQFLDAPSAIDAEIQSFLNYWKNIQDASPLILDKLNRHIFELYGTSSQPCEEILEKTLRECVDIESVPEVVQSPESLIGHELELENEEEDEIDREAELEEKLPESKVYQDLVSYSEQDGYRVCEFFEKTFEPIQNFLPKDMTLLHMNQLFYSPNLFLDNARLGSSLAGTYQLPGRFLLAIRAPEKARSYLLVSHEDAARIKKGICSTKLAANQTLALFSLNGTLVATSNNKVPDDALHSQMLMQAKLLTGKVNLSKEEMDALSKISSKPLASLAALFEDIIKYKPTCAKRYFGSPLEKLLHPQYQTTPLKIQRKGNSMPSPK